MSSPIKKTLTWYALLVTIVPSVLLAIAFGVTCSIECTALPWLAVFIGPPLWLIWFTATAVTTYVRASRFDEQDCRKVRRVVVSSILWAAPATYACFAIMLIALEALFGGANDY
jgi:hypothetical protein